MPTSAANTLIDRTDAFNRALRGWYASHHRLLPWRAAPSLYKTVVSEFMLQQTQVDTVLPYFERWMRDFPDFHHLAEAHESAVLKAWEGLGYYRRARNLHALAQALVRLPEPPRTADGWLVFPGVGPYTAAAIASIAFDDPVAVVDGNVIRILSRLTADGREFRDNADAVKALDPLAQALMDVTAPGDHNQAMMELGATVCYRRKPLCVLCPVREFCQAAALGDPEAYPRLRPKATVKITINRLWLEHEGALLLARKPADSQRLADIHELPETLHLMPLLDESALLARKQRGISNQIIQERIYQGIATPELRRLVDDDPHLVWVPVDQLDTITLSGPHKKWIAERLGKNNTD